MSEDANADSYFLSYSRSDERFALRLAKDLRAKGVNMWVDQLDIRPSEHWDRAIERAVCACRGLIVILSPRSVASDNVADEISFAIDNGKSVLPVMIEKCVLPLRITRMHLIDATTSYEEALRQCLEELNDGQAQSAPATARTTVPPLDPEIVATAKQKLTAVLGPIAGILVDKAAARSSSAAELYALLAQHIENEHERARFTHGSVQKPLAPSAAEPSANAATISPVEIASLAGALTSYLGPMAPIVAKRESRACTSIAELRQRLAAHIDGEADRKSFLRQTGGG
jgi:hypothetical protein